MSKTHTHTHTLGPPGAPASLPYLTPAVEFIGEFDLTEGDGRLHPMRAKIGRVRVDVDAARGLRLGLAAGHPLPVHVLPAVVVGGHEVQQEGIHGVGVEAGDAGLQHREHPPAGWRETQGARRGGRHRRLGLTPGLVSATSLTRLGRLAT